MDVNTGHRSDADPTTVVRTASGALLLVGSARVGDTEAALARFLSDGTLDESFANASLDLPLRGVSGQDAAVHGDGAVLALDRSRGSDMRELLVARVDAHGVLDPLFG